jgi:predicted phosphatase
MKIFIDFDDVIFNTKQFKEDLTGIFLSNGIDRELYEKNYYNPDDKRAVRTYDPAEQIARLKKVASFDEGKILEDVELFLRDASKYVFPDVKDFITNFGNENVFILSYGDIDFQKKKISSSRITEYVGNIFVTDKLKAEMLEKIIKEGKITKDEKIFFLDDRTEQICDVKSRLGRIVTILVKRPEGRYRDMEMEEHCDCEVCSLNEAKEIISKII